MSGPAGSPMHKEAADLVSALVELESVNPGLHSGGSGEGQVATFVAEWLHRHGLEVDIDEPVSGRPSVIARKRGSGSGPSLLLTGHTDTVALGGEWAAVKPLREDGRVYGRGAYDMKGGIAAILLAVEALSDTELAGDLLVGAVSDEEAQSLGTASMLERIDAEAAILSEPTDLDLVVAHKGFAWFTIATSGRAAHGSQHEEGRDAIAGMGAILGRLGELSARLARTGADHPLLGRGSIHASTITGGTEYSTYPASCELRLERRTVPDNARDALEEEVRWLASAAEDIDGLEATARLDLLREPFEVATDEPIVAALERGARSATGGELRHVGDAAWTDAALLCAHGIPTVVFGPSGGGAHAEREWVELRDVETCAATLAEVATGFCGTAGIGGASG